MDQIKMNSPQYHEKYLNHEVKTFGEKRLIFTSNFYKEYETCIWRECSCGDHWEGPCTRSFN
jgi:hypothetical protein